MGWNQLQRLRPSVLLEGVPGDAYFYFAHTYAALDAGDAAVAMCDHGAPFVAALERENLFAVQFHPEKSGIWARTFWRTSSLTPRARRQRRMTLARRIIPCLDTDGERVVKGVKFVNLRDAGDPAALAARYNEEGADELVVLDIAASRDHRPTFLETIRRVAAELAIPLTAGGGVATVDEGRAILRAGADKLTVNTAALRRPELLTELAAEFGSQAVVLAIDAKRVGDHWEAFVRGGREPTGGRRAWAQARRGLRRGRNPADLDGPRRHPQRIRSGSDRSRFDRRQRAGDRFRRRRRARGFSGRVCRRPCRRRAGRFHFSRRHPRSWRTEALPRLRERSSRAAACRTLMIIPCIDLQDGRAVQLVHGRKRRLAVDDVFGLLDRFRDIRCFT